MWRIDMNVRFVALGLMAMLGRAEGIGELIPAVDGVTLRIR